MGKTRGRREGEGCSRGAGNDASSGPRSSPVPSDNNPDESNPDDHAGTPRHAPPRHAGLSAPPSSSSASSSPPRSLVVGQVQHRQQAQLEAAHEHAAVEAVVAQAQDVKLPVGGEVRQRAAEVVVLGRGRGWRGKGRAG